MNSNNLQCEMDFEMKWVNCENDFNLCQTKLKNFLKSWPYLVIIPFFGLIFSVQNL